jgi:hypothetical protein
MEGVIHRYFDDLTLGLIRGSNGRKYAFSRTEWRPQDCEPQEGMTVVFQSDPGRAVNVRLSDSSVEKKEAQ